MQVTQFLLRRHIGVGGMKKHILCEGFWLTYERAGGFEIYCALRNEVHLIPVFPPSDGTDEEAYVAAFEQAIDTASSKVRGLLFCNPQNPRGQVYRRGKIEALLRLCGRRELHFISDEVYALTAFDKSDEDTAADKFVSAMQMDLNDLGVDASRLHVLHSTSKDLGSSGLRMVSKFLSFPSTKADTRASGLFDNAI